MNIILEKKVVQKVKFSKDVNNKMCATKIIFFNEKNVKKDLDNFRHRKLNLKVRILQFLTTFTQLTARLKNFLSDWLLALGIKEGLVYSAIVCLNSEVILISVCNVSKLYNL